MSAAELRQWLVLAAKPILGALSRCASLVILLILASVAAYSNCATFGPLRALHLRWHHRGVLETSGGPWVKNLAQSGLCGGPKDASAHPNESGHKRWVLAAGGFQRSGTGSWATRASCSCWE